MTSIEKIQLQDNRELEVLIIKTSKNRWNVFNESLHLSGTSKVSKVLAIEDFKFKLQKLEEIFDKVI